VGSFDSSVVFPAFELILVAKNLERIGDHATNIAEDVIYQLAGVPNFWLLV
jgi:phosphate transport system protein